MKTKIMISQIKTVHTILYVKDQSLSTAFYQNIFRKEPDLHVPGMTEFSFSENFKLGLMPIHGIKKILGNKTPNLEQGLGIPRVELYFYVDDIDFEYKNALQCGAQLICPISEYDWGDMVCYFSDPDAHIIAFAEKIKSKT